MVEYWPGGRRTGDELGLEGGAMGADEGGGVAAGPGGQLHRAHRDPVLGPAQLQPVAVPEELGRVEELGDELLHVRRVRRAPPVGLSHRLGPVRVTTS